MGDPLKALLKQLQKVKKDAIEKGVRPMASATSVISTTSTQTAEAPEEFNDAPASNPRHLVVSGTNDYMNAIKKLPRQLLEARYLKDVGEPCPPVPREWIIEKMARKAQVEAYLKFEGEIPASVLRNNARFALIRPPRISVDGGEDGGVDDDSDEPSKDERKFDPTMKAHALVGNPFSRGLAFQMFALIEGQEASGGIQYQAMVLLLKTLNNMAQDWAERKVQKVFTKWVDKGWVELV